MHAYKNINLDFLKNFTGNDTKKIVRYINMFLQSAPAAIQTMQKQLDLKDFTALKTTAHSLKPQLSYMGITSLKETILRIEEFAGEQKYPDKIQELIKTVETECNIAFDELLDAIEKLS